MLFAFKIQNIQVYNVFVFYFRIRVPTNNTFSKQAHSLQLLCYVGGGLGWGHVGMEYAWLVYGDDYDAHSSNCLRSSFSF